MLHLHPKSLFFLLEVFSRIAMWGFMCIFSSPIHRMEINSAEVFAVLRIVKISISDLRLCNMTIIIESNLANVVNWCTSDNSGGPWNLNFLLNFIRSSLKNGRTPPLFIGVEVRIQLRTLLQNKAYLGKMILWPGSNIVLQVSRPS